MNERIEKWLNRYQNPNTQTQMRIRIETFLKATGKTDDELIEMSPEDLEDLILNYQREQVAKGIPHNTILSVISSPRALFKVLRKPLVFGRGSLLKLQSAQDRYVFSNGDLGHLFDCADIRMKALISTATSLGWAVSDVLILDKKYISTLLERAKDESQKFVFFNKDRIKTGSKALGVLNPLSVEWLSKWLAINKDKDLFGMREDEINQELKRLSVEAGLKTTGSVTFHAFRSWVFSSLVKAGFSDFEAKMVVGKQIPLSEGTDLHIEEEVKQKYMEKYEKYLNIKPQIEGTSLVALKALEKENKEYKEKIEGLQARITEMQKNLSDITPQLNELMKDLKSRQKKEAKEERMRPEKVDKLT